MIIELIVGFIIGCWCLSQQKQINKLKDRCGTLENVLAGEVELKQLTDGKTKEEKEDNEFPLSFEQLEKIRSQLPIHRADIKIKWSRIKSSIPNYSVIEVTDGGGDILILGKNYWRIQLNGHDTLEHYQKIDDSFDCRIILDALKVRKIIEDI